MILPPLDYTNTKKTLKLFPSKDCTSKTKYSLYTFVTRIAQVKWSGFKSELPEIQMTK